MNAIPVASSLLCHFEQFRKALSSITFHCPLVSFSAFRLQFRTGSCFARSLVSSLIVFFMPPPRAPVITGTIVTVYPGLLSLISKASCRYRVSLSVRFVSMFCCIGHAMSQIQICFSFFSSSIKSGLLAVSVFLKLNWKSQTSFAHRSPTPFVAPIVLCTISCQLRLTHIF